MDKYIKELQDNYNVYVIFHEQNSLILELTIGEEIVNISIKYKDDFPISIPIFEVLNNNKYMSKGILPNDFEMKSIDTNWKYNLVCVFDEIMSNIGLSLQSLNEK